MEVGLRVVRGPDWKWGNQDEGEGHIGTVVEIGKAGSATSPDKTVVVQWDSGSRTNYRVGYQNAYDLRLLDNAPVGVKHPNIICDNCRKHGITGMRWKCARCFDFDLCTLCYMAGKHELTHPFLRQETAGSQCVGIEMPVRQGAVKVQAKGIFANAKVVRGPDWDWSNQDGGEGKVGKVIDIRGWDNESGRSVANVTWSNGSTNVYRLGHKGKVDLKYVQEGNGGFYYRDHLPILGQNVEVLASVKSTSPHSPFNVGDKVKVKLTVEDLRLRQEGHGGWNPRMADFIGKLGTVHRVTDKGDIRVQYEGCNNRWTFHPAALIKVRLFSTGDMVRIVEDSAVVMQLQKDHGEWVDEMVEALGKIGKVIKLYLDGDLRVAVDGQTWTFNPLCVLPMPGSATELNNTMNANQREEHTNPLLGPLLAEHSEGSRSESLVREAAQGKAEQVRELLAKFPEEVDTQSAGKTALQVACHQGYLSISLELIGAGANVETQDDDGDTALHYSAFGNKPELMEMLLNKNANIDAVNKARCTALHVAVNKQHANCVKVLIQNECNINIQDSYGDTALHDAIGKDNLEIIDLLINVPKINFSLKNNRGFNVLHHAALKGNHFATERLITKSRQIVDVKKDDGFAAIHLAALNGHYQVAEMLLTTGQCEVDTSNNRRQTPLLLAVNQGHCSLVELLVKEGHGDIHASDEDGDTSLHLSLLKTFPASHADQLQDAPVILTILEELQQALPDPPTHGHVISCFLAQSGANPHSLNHKGKTPLDSITNPVFKDIMMAFSLKHQLPQAQAMILGESGDNGMDIMVECVVCCEAQVNVKFEPCGHRVVCNECCIRMKKCITCQELICKKIGPGGQLISHKTRQSSAERMKYLENKIQEIEDSHNCSICMERRRNVVFLCGHSACVTCAQTLKNCHMCRKPITKKINLY